MQRVPSWVHRIGMAAWVTDAAGHISYFNPKAEALLGRNAESCLGKPCHLVIGGLSPAGVPHCGPGCPVARQARGGAEIGPFELRVPIPGGTPRSIEVIAIAAQTGSSRTPQIVHCARSLAPSRPAERFVRRIASRTAGRSPGAQRDPATKLTPRQQEILELLAADETLQSIASRLHISYATVRNHVQHILAKMRAHSILQAVAAHLLEQESE